MGARKARVFAVMIAVFSTVACGRAGSRGVSFQDAPGNQYVGGGEFQNTPAIPVATAPGPQTVTAPPQAPGSAQPQTVPDIPVARKPQFRPAELVVNWPSRNVSLNVVDPRTKKAATLHGRINEQDNTATLKSDDKSLEAVTTCIDGADCKRASIDLYEKQDKRYVHNQFVAAKKGRRFKIDEVRTPTDTGNPDETHYGGFVGKIPEDVKNEMEQGELYSGRPQAIGAHYRGGRLINAARLPYEGPGFRSKYFSKRGSNNESSFGIWGTDLEVQKVELVSLELTRLFPNRAPLSIGDLSKKFGGKFTHKSHQNGLDVDVAFPLRVFESETHWPKFFDHKNVRSEIDVERTYAALKLFALGDQTVMIFIDKKIKAALCRYSRSINDYSDDPSTPTFQLFNKLRHEGGHENHFHVRFQCPAASPACQIAQKVPESYGTGCP